MARTARIFLLLFLLFGCISPRQTPEAEGGLSVAGITPVATPPEASDPAREEPSEKPPADATPKIARTPKDMAEEFDRFLKGGLSVEEHARLKSSCETAPEVNPFCFTVLNIHYFQEKEEKKKKQTKKARMKRVAPLYRKGELQNWHGLRMAPVSATIGGVSALRKARLGQLKQLAFDEKQCPLNIAISIAASLEDGLPKSSDVGEIARLYEKGGDCLPDEEAEDKASILTRAGLFFLLQKKPERAYEVFARAAKIPKAVSSRPLYWKHRAEKALGKQRQAEKSLEALADKYPFSFHTVVAQTAMNADPGRLLERPHRDAKRSQQVPAINLLIEQVELLHEHGFDDSSRTVLDWAVMESDGVEPEVKIYLAELKDQKSDNHLEKIKLLSNVLYDNPGLISKKSLELYFPKPYFPIFEKHSSGLDPFLLLAIARQESAFNPHAVSSANAVGLLQVVPATGKRVNNAGRKALMKPETNIKTGAVYLQKLLKTVDGQIHLAMAAYNAGPTKLREWLKRYPTDDPILFIDILPYRETRDYVALVLRNYYWYRRMHGTSEDAKAISRRVFETSK